MLVRGNLVLYRLISSNPFLDSPLLILGPLKLVKKTHSESTLKSHKTKTRLEVKNPNDTIESLSRLSVTDLKPSELCEKQHFGPISKSHKTKTKTKMRNPASQNLDIAHDIIIFNMPVGVKVHVAGGMEVSNDQSLSTGILNYFWFVFGQHRTTRLL